MKKLIKANKELISLVDDDGNTALHLACIQGYVDVATKLIDNGAAVDARSVHNTLAIFDLLYSKYHIFWGKPGSPLCLLSLLQLATV